ncbi:hypothetical protein Sjap_018444 [Stephania japonica]|uniref:Uncharacterized protein n=1 Tax=Stephania japonica TaxID=461633 RepID=A0AAP0I812_9MAGN
MNKLKWEPSKLVNDANLLGLSLEKRVIPRWMVIQCLLSKCLIKDNVIICNVIKLTEAKFLEKQIMELKPSSPWYLLSFSNFFLWSTQFVRPISTTANPPSDESSSFTVSYLINSCGLSPESALSASNKVQFKSALKPDLVLHFLRNHGFSNTHIANLATKRPLLLLAKPAKTLLPKLEFLKQVGFSEDQIADFLSKDPTFLCRSLEGKVKPSYEYLKGLLGTNERVAAAIKSSRATWILRLDLERIIGCKVEILRNHGVPQGNIVKFIAANMRSLGNKSDKFEELVSNVSERGFDPSNMLFVHAINVFSGMKRDTLEAKLQLFRSHGWSEHEIAESIRKQLFFVSLSEENLKRGLDFFMNKLKWNSSELAKCTNMLGLSLEKRVIPRWMVIQCLLSKCLIKDSISIRSVLALTEVKFLEQFLDKYKSRAPEILELYRGTS